MKKCIAIICVLFFSILLSSCSGVDQEKYDKKISELKATEKKLEEKDKELEDTKKELDNANESYNKLFKEFSDLKKEETQEELTEAGAKAWVETCFGEKADTIISGTNLYVIISNGYTVSEKSVNKLTKTVLSGMRVYMGYCKEKPEQLPYDTVSVIILDEYTGLDMISFQFIKNDDGSFSKNQQMVSCVDSIKLIQYLNKALTP